ncbi:MAG: ABC transporter ATP-binding protein/permease [Lachnospiraceae bacterium]|nr:ABC transporter ATP-binding protein/permease [Lachnospiraceae bacterium]
MKSKERKSGLSGLFKYAKNYAALSVTGCIFSGVSAVMSLVPYVCLYFIIEGLFSTYPDYTNEKEVFDYGWMAVIFAAGSLVIYFAGLLLTHFAAFRISKNMKKAAIAHAVDLPMGYVSKKSSGKLRKIINDNADMTETFLAHQLPDTVGALVLPVAILIMLFMFDIRLGILCLLPMIIGVVFLSKMFVGKNMGFMQTYMDALEDMNSGAVEYIRGMPVVKVFQQSVYSFENFYRSIMKYKEFASDYALNCRIPMVGFTIATNGAAFFLVPAAIIILASTDNPKAFFLDFMFYALFSPVCGSMMTRIMYAAETTMQASQAINRIDELLEEKTLCDPDEKREPKDSSIEFDNVTFSYEKGQNPALKNISFLVEPGQTVALVGASGGGKTTAASLVPRFFDADTGTVKIGGVDVRDIEEEKLMRQVAFVFQDTHLFKDTIRENIRIAKPDATEQEINEALMAAQCDDILRKMPDGADTVIEEKGVYLSGGEKQRLSLARAILKDAPVIILDEATAFADSENEAAIQRAFEELIKDKTVLMIAHRLSTVRNADKIIVLEEGILKESGTHEKLLEKNGIYAKMWRDYRSSVEWKFKKEVSA